MSCHGLSPLYDPANPGDCTIIRIALSAFLAAKSKEGILTAELGDNVIEVLLRAEALRLSNSTMATISHILRQENRGILDFPTSQVTSATEAKAPVAWGSAEALLVRETETDRVCEKISEGVPPGSPHHLSPLPPCSTEYPSRLFDRVGGNLCQNYNRLRILAIRTFAPPGGRLHPGAAEAQTAWSVFRGHPVSWLRHSNRDPCLRR